MKKSLLGAAGVVAAIALGAYPAATWYFGKQLEAELDRQYATLAQVPLVEVAERRFERGVYRSTETVRMRWKPEFLAAVAAGTSASSGTGLDRVAIEARTEYEHGPFPGLSSPAAAARAESRVYLVSAEGEPRALTDGGGEPLVVRTRFELDGSGSGRFSGRAFEIALPDDTRMRWGGIDVAFRFSADRNAVQAEGTIPALEITDASKLAVVMKGIALDMDATRPFAEAPLFFIGNQRISVAQMQVTPPPGQDAQAMSMRNLVLEGDVPLRDGFVDLSYRIGADEVRLGDDVVGPARYDYSVTHLHAPTLVALYEEMLKLYARPELFRPGSDPGQILASLAEPARRLLEHDPGLRLDRLSFAMPEGEVVLSVAARLRGVQLAELENPMLLLPKLELDGSASVSAPLLTAFAVKSFQRKMAAADPTRTVSADEARMVEAQIEAQIHALTGKGYVERDGLVLRSTIRFRNGEMQLNGKPFDPMALSR